MSAPKRNADNSIFARLRESPGIHTELSRLENAVNKNIRKSWPSSPLRYNGQVAAFLLEDLVAVVGPNDWRPPVERTAVCLRRAASCLDQGVRLIRKAIDISPAFTAIPGIVKRQPKGALPPGIGFTEALELHKVRQAHRLVEPKTFATHFLIQISDYAQECGLQARRIERILKVRDRRFDRLGPILSLIEDVHGSTGEQQDAAISRLLTDAFEVTGDKKQFSPDAIRKYRERYLPWLSQPARRH